MSDEPIYSIENLSIDLYATTVSVRAVDGVSFNVRPGETVAVVGESGSGKTVMTLGPLGLLPEGVTVDIKGSARAEASELVGMESRRLSDLRGRYFGVIFQDPMSALNPMLDRNWRARRAALPISRMRMPARKRSRCSPAPASRTRKTATIAILMKCRAACCSAP